MLLTWKKNNKKTHKEERGGQEHPKTTLPPPPPPEYHELVYRQTYNHVSFFWYFSQSVSYSSIVSYSAIRPKDPTFWIIS